MKEKRFLAVLFILVGILITNLSSNDTGVVVEEVGKNSAGERAGIQKGDILLSWERPPNPPSNPEGASGVIESVFDFMMIEMEQSPRGLVKLVGERDGERMAFEVLVGGWKIKIRPTMTDSILKNYKAGKELVKGEEEERGIQVWKEIAKSMESAEDLIFSCWIYLEIGNAWVKIKKWDEAHNAYQAALKNAEISKNIVAQAAVWKSLGTSFDKQNDFDKAIKAYKTLMKIREKNWGESISLAKSLIDLGIAFDYYGDLEKAESCYKRSLAICEKLAPESRTIAAVLNNLGEVARQRGELDKAESYYKRALAIYEKVTPDSLDVTYPLDNLGLIARRRGDLEIAEAYHKRAYEICKRVAPGSIDVAFSLGNLGIVAKEGGDYKLAENYFNQALSIFDKFAPDGVLVGFNLNNLGTVAIDRGDFEKAEVLLLKSLKIKERTSPDSLALATTWENLGIVARRRYDLEKAEYYLKRALAIKEKKAPDSIITASTYLNLGTVASDSNDFEKAEAYYKRALAIEEKLNPQSITASICLNNLGNAAVEREDLEAAKSFYQRAIAIQEKISPEILDLALSLNNLGDLAYKLGKLEEAETLCKRALAIRRKLAPFSIREAFSLHSLGKIQLKKGQLHLAVDYLRRSIEALEAQISRLGGSKEVKAGFRAKYKKYYQDYIDVLLRLKQSQEAFHILERSRAQMFLSMLAERDLVFTPEVPEELERERKRNAFQYDKVQRELAQLNPSKHKEQIDHLLTKLRELQDGQVAIAEKIRKTSPRFSSLVYPQPLDLSSVQEVLDPGTVMLSYSIGEEQGYLFVITSDGGFWIHSLSIKEGNLRKDVERFRRQIQRGQAELPVQKSLVARGKHLYETLIHPAAEIIKKNKRILIIPDGPLHVLPFGALVRNIESEEKVSKKSGRDWQYLIEWRPLHMVVSGTVYGEMKKQRRVGETKQKGKILLAFGDPKYPVLEEGRAEGLEDAVVRSMALRGYDLTPLLATRQEVSTIARIYGEKAEICLGDEATEERAKSVSKDVKYVHFACHGFIDEQFPLNSGLALTIPPKPKEGQDNGILQAWEIFERVRIDADLVSLSACQTGLGKEMGGEGLVGLTRAFQYAGARSVLASLWEVADVTTAELMKQFYEYLKKGLSKDEALRKAKMDMIRKPIEVKNQEGKTQKMDASHPFFWDAFQLIGDWR
jgi:CHAT domain-containing protein/Tfp pilus assembly protein PilF